MNYFAGFKLLSPYYRMKRNVINAKCILLKLTMEVLNMSKSKPSVLKRHTKFNGKWLNFEEVEYVDSSQKVRSWENVSRTTLGGAVAMIARKGEKLILVRQFRPPIGNYIIEFPAGLIDGGEKYETAALRELKEETGYIGEVTGVTCPVYSSPGMTNETTALVYINIDESVPENLNPKPEMEQTEDIEVLLVELKMLKSFLEECVKSGDFIDAKVMSFCAGINFNVII